MKKIYLFQKHHLLNESFAVFSSLLTNKQHYERGIKLFLRIFTRFTRINSSICSRSLDKGLALFRRNCILRGALSLCSYPAIPISKRLVCFTNTLRATIMKIDKVGPCHGCNDITLINHRFLKSLILCRCTWNDAIKPVTLYTIQPRTVIK